MMNTGLSAGVFPVNAHAVFATVASISVHANNYIGISRMYKHLKINCQLLKCAGVEISTILLVWNFTLSNHLRFLSPCMSPHIFTYLHSAGKKASCQTFPFLIGL